MSKLWKLDGNDFTKGLIVAVVVAVLTLLLKILQANGIHLTLADLELILTSGIISGIGYLLKNIGTDSADKIMGGTDK